MAYLETYKCYCHSLSQTITQSASLDLNSIHNIAESQNQMMTAIAGNTIMTLPKLSDGPSLNPIKIAL